MQRGDIWWRETPGGKRRPVLVLTRDEVLGRLTSILVAHVSTVDRGLASEVRLDEDDGMPRACVVNLDNVNVTSVAYLTERITQLDGVRMRQVCAAFDFATGC